MGTTSVRRNLFHHHLSRRPVSTAPPNPSMPSGTASGVSSLSSHIIAPAANESTSSLSSGSGDTGEIVVRDKNGGYKLDVPVLPHVVGEDGDEMEGVEGSGATGGSAATGTDSTAQTEISGREKESACPYYCSQYQPDLNGIEIEASLVEMMCRNRNRQMSNEPAEILGLIQQSLQNKVAALDEDNWMYEPEPNSRV
ncbi:hypothetical protein ATEIFO6365_0007005600 [Aspergillus terreus]|uniref:Uncharacterized protein n=1 Tax=Aspergillus terreus TaxID=33178 RepID=A0A5M3Z3R6_ASPTE|nr:hypothetical protein ATETN484_0009005600 [Aspergillus terreus]GFF17507.1 hypothetical protein ATEIFO6365_0007005600 [Aspergillus terreus]